MDEKKPLPKMVFLWGAAFDDAAEFIREVMHARITSGNVASIGFSFISLPVNESLAVEIYLKCLHLLVSGELPEGHELLKLFDTLPKQCEEMVERCYDIHAKKCKDYEPDIRVMLQNQNKAFVKYRYLYEKTVPGEAWGTEYQEGVLRHTMRDVLLEIQPEWKNLITGLGKRAT